MPEYFTESSFFKTYSPTLFLPDIEFRYLNREKYRLH